MSFVLGQWKADCDRCGFTYQNVQLRLEWTGLRVCHECWEIRHPQQHLRGKIDRQAPPWVRPEQEGLDVSPGSGNEVSGDDL